MKHKPDRPLTAILIGVLAVIPIELLSQYFKSRGLLHTSVFEYTSLMVNSKPDWWIGVLTGPGMASFGTLLVYYSSLFWNTDYFPFKAAYIGLIFYSAIAILNNLLSDFQMPAIEHFMQAFSGVTGGFIAGYLVKRFLFRADSFKSALFR